MSYATDADEAADDARVGGGQKRPVMQAFGTAHAAAHRRTSAALLATPAAASPLIPFTRTLASLLRLRCCRSASLLRPPAAVRQPPRLCAVECLHLPHLLARRRSAGKGPSSRRTACGWRASLSGLPRWLASCARIHEVQCQRCLFLFLFKKNNELWRHHTQEWVAAWIAWQVMRG